MPRKGSVFLSTLPAPTGDHLREGRRYAVVVTATNFIGSIVTVAPTSTSTSTPSASTTASSDQHAAA